MIQIQFNGGDAEGFVAQVELLANGIVNHHGVAELSLIKIDNWFGLKWLQFSGKMDGGFGVWKLPVTIPPFVPSRVVWERRFCAPAYAEADRAAELHLRMPSATAMQRRVQEVAPGAALLWFSGNTRGNGRGSTMGYVPVGERVWTWWVEWAGNGSWKPIRVRGISADELQSLQAPPRQPQER